ncbi:hypothetical protein H0H93_007294 [Arthromyces matolae]|nr:hypothetical protein H0H93_007294 [Arthromyces matolae]
MYLTLPVETRLQIAAYCTPSTLSSLALVTSILQREAEKTLYSSISLNTDHIESLKQAFQTLGTNPRKAATVQFFAVEAIDRRNDDPVEADIRRFLVRELIQTLPKLTSLTNLRLDFRPRCPQPSQDELKSMLKEAQGVVHVKLRALFCNYWFDFSDLFINQRDLQLLGIYADQPLEGSLLQLLRHIRQFITPLIFSISEASMPQSQRSCFGTDKHIRITLFPAFQPSGMDNSARFRALKLVIDNERGLGLDFSKVWSLHVYFETLEDTEFVSLYIFHAAQCFSNLKVVVLLTQRFFEIVPADIMTIIKPVRNLEHLSFQLYKEEEETVSLISTELITDKSTKSAYARQWWTVCPELKTVSFGPGPPTRRFHLQWAVWVL